MKLKSIRVQDFKAISDATIEMTDATLLVGANNAGKSSLLQAIHFATRLMKQAAEANKISTVSLTELEYIPTHAYKRLNHGSLNWGNRSDQPESAITFTFQDPEAEEEEHISASIVIKSARNEGLSVTPSIPPKLQPLFRGSDSTFTSYIPGLAGIPLQEEVISWRHVERKAASGDSNVILRNVLYRIKTSGRLNELIELMQGIYKDSRIDIRFDEKKDFFIDVDVNVGNAEYTKPLELCGTGFLQTIQIFSYLVLFNPKILLIDEPEAHLHPNIQTELIRSLERNVRRKETFVLLTTHSPFVARGLPIGANSIWIADGTIAATSNDETIRDALGWGALDTPIIIFTEDNNTKLLRDIISQDSQIEKSVSVFPFGGVERKGVAPLVDELKRNLGNRHKVIVHRDRDCMTNEELQGWCQEYYDRGISVWITEGSDIESYHCHPGVVAAVLGISEADANEIIEEAYQRDEEKLRREFYGKRQDINKRIYEKSGGSPNIEGLWADLEYHEKIKGKSFLKSIRSVARDKGNNEKMIGRTSDKIVIAPSLISLIRKEINDA